MQDSLNCVFSLWNSSCGAYSFIFMIVFVERFNPFGRVLYYQRIRNLLWRSLLKKKQSERLRVRQGKKSIWYADESNLANV